MRAVKGLEVLPGFQGVDQVVGDAHPEQGLGEAVGVVDIALHDLHRVEPFAVGQVPGPTGHHPDGEAGGQQLGNKATTDVSGSAGYQRHRAAGEGSFDRGFDERFGCHGRDLTVSSTGGRDLTVASGR